MRTTITADPHAPHRCTLTHYLDAGDCRVVWVFVAPSGGGLVTRGTNERLFFVGDRLGRYGTPLVWNPRVDAQLVSLIRREWARRQQQLRYVRGRGASARAWTR